MDQKSPEAFRTISEVADWLGVPTHVLRFWESRFSQVKPVKRAGGRRYYRPSDMELLGGIRKLLHEDGMTIRGVQKLLREQGVKHVAAMSPSLDASVTEKDITPDNVVDLSDRRDTREEAQIDEAELVEPPSDDADEPKRGFPFDDDDEPMPAPPEAAATPEPAEPEMAAEDAPLAPATDETAADETTPDALAEAPAEPDAADSTTAWEALTADTAAPDEAALEAPTAEAPGLDEEAAAPMEALGDEAVLAESPLPAADLSGDIDAPPPEEPTSDAMDLSAEAIEPEAGRFEIDDALPSPDAMDFLAHEAPPESLEADVSEAAPATPAPEPETDPDDPMSSPDALAFSAHGAEPELVEASDEADSAPADDTVPDRAPEVEPELAQAPEPEPEPEAEPVEPEAAPEPPAPPALVMPELDDDPDDDDREAGVLLAAQLRGLRGKRRDVNIAALQALADRLDEITRRIDRNAGRAGGL